MDAALQDASYSEVLKGGMNREYGRYNHNMVLAAISVKSTHIYSNIVIKRIPARQCKLSTFL